MSRVLVYCCPLLGVVQPAASRGNSARKTQKHFLSGSWSYDFSRVKMISPSSQLWGPRHSMLVKYVYFCTGVMIWGVLQFSHPFCLGCLGRVCFSLVSLLLFHVMFLRSQTSKRPNRAKSFLLWLPAQGIEAFLESWSPYKLVMRGYLCDKGTEVWETKLFGRNVVEKRWWLENYTEESVISANYLYILLPCLHFESVCFL